MITDIVTQTVAVAETLKGWTNFSISVLLSLCLGAFTVFVFGRQNSLAHRIPVASSWLVRIGLSMCSAGALLNAITFSNPSWSEVLLNGGLCVVFLWAAWFHYVRFVKPLSRKRNGKSRKATK
jgi:hypothetical protein